MGTRFRTMLAPIGLSTGDGRRFGNGAISLADLPMPFEWARSREGGHDGAVQVGVVQEATLATVKEALANDWVSPEGAKGMAADQQAIWARGELFDDADREAMPRLAEDVAEALHLITAGTLGPSVDLDSFEGVPVMQGSDEAVSWEQIEDYVEKHGEEPNIELLITQGRVRAATLVSIPAFAETSRPLELIAQTEPAEGEAAAETDTLALVASIAPAPLPLVEYFALPKLDGPTPITFDWESGAVFGHIALFGTCHVGYSDVCVTPPRDESGGYAWFNRHPVETQDGDTIWAGRITVGGNHAGLALNASSTMAEYDRKVTAAHVRAYEDEFGIVVAGVLALPADAPERAALDRRKVSGDWRETPAGLSLVEVLALSPGARASSEPGFPVGTFSRSGRQVALTASLGPEPQSTPTPQDLDLIETAVRRAFAAERKAEEYRLRAGEARLALAAYVESVAEKERAQLAAALGTTQEG